MIERRGVHIYISGFTIRKQTLTRETVEIIENLKISENNRLDTLFIIMNSLVKT